MLLCLLLRLKCWSARGASQHPDFTGNCTTISHMFFSLIYPVDEFSLKEMRMWGQSKISSYCFFVWCKSRELEGRRSSRFPCLTAVVGTSSYRVAFRTLKQRRSSSLKTVNGLNTLTVSTKNSTRLSTSFQTRI